MRLQGHGFDLKIEPLSSPDGEGWLQVDVKFQAPGVVGHYPAYVQPSDFATFVAELDAMGSTLKPGGVARLQTSEGEVLVVLTMRSLGKIDGTYLLRTGQTTDGQVEVTGDFGLDQSYLSELQRGSKETLESLKRDPRRSP